MDEPIPYIVRLAPSASSSNILFLVIIANILLHQTPLGVQIVDLLECVFAFGVKNRLKQYDCSLLELLQPVTK